MDQARAISLVRDRIQDDGHDYPTHDLVGAQFDGGWCVYAPIMIADDAPDTLVTRSVFLVSETGRVEEVTSGAPVADATLWFEESCIWFTAGAAPGEWSPDTGLPSHPDLGGSSRPRPPANYDREAVDVLARALAQERDFGGWLGDRLRDLADLLGGGSRLVSRSPHAWASRHVSELLEPYGEERPEVWRTWPRIDPATLPEVDTTGWTLAPPGIILERAEHAPRWLACGVADLMPQLVAVRRTDLPDKDIDALRQLNEDGDADVDALLRLAVDAELNNRETITIDAPTTATYRRVLDRLGLQFENYGYEAMFE